MTLANIGAWILAPFIAASAFAGSAAMSHANPSASDTPRNSIVQDVLRGNWHWPGHGPTAPATTTLAITSENPTEGAVGTTVVLKGSGFTKDSVVRFGDGMIPSSDVTTVSKNGTKLAFTVPSYIGPYCAPGTACPMYAILVKPGAYDVRVQNGTSTQSNAVTFTVVGTSTHPTPSKLSITGIDAPTSLAVNAEGSWTVNVARPADMGGNLHYSVVWGDEPAMGLRAMSAAQLQSSATFSHSYGSAGTYSPKFTVTDDQGHSATVSATVQVTD